MLTGKIILVVEDDPLISQVYVHRLASAKATVLTAFDGADGLEKLKQNKVDLVILDLMMPHMDGKEMLERMRKEPATATTPVMVLTNFQARKPEEIEELRKLGIVEYLVKSNIFLEEILEKIEHHLGTLDAKKAAS